MACARENLRGDGVLLGGVRSIKTWGVGERKT